MLATSSSCPASALAQGSIEDEARLVDKAGKPIGNADDGIALGVDSDGRPEPQPAPARHAATWPRGDGRDRDRQVDRREAGLRGRPDRSARSPTGPCVKYEISGIVRFGSVDSLGGATISVFDLPTAQRLFDKHGKLDLIRVGAEAGVDERRARRVRSARSSPRRRR